MNEQTEYSPTNQVKAVERNAIQEYEITPSKVKELVKGYMELRVLPADKNTYKAAHEGKMILVKTRTSIDKRRKQLGEDARKWVSEVNDAAKQLLEPIEPVEAHLKSELKVEDNRIEGIRLAKIVREEKRVSDIREKIEEIVKFKHLTFDNRNSEFIGDLILRLDEIAITDEAFEEFRDEALKEQVAADVRLGAAYDARVIWEAEQESQKIEAERLKKVRLVQEAEQKKIQEDQQKIYEEKAKLQKEKAEADERRWRGRLEQLKDVSWNGQEALNRDTNDLIITYDDLVELTVTEFQKVATAYNKIIDDKRESQAEEDRKEKERFQAEAKKQAEKDAEENARQKAEEAEYFAKAEAEKAAKAEALKPDKDKLMTLAVRIKALSLPKVKSKEAQDLIFGVKDRLQVVSKGLLADIDEL